ncbi:winged helix-turn-helix domain-containing protein [filamentous cyanobacterium LEGE 11480]|uniref:Winged helix-turn-helix domain-containing protein n=1 Tax=Romeriopsis navalis LEGE 11480 TaxID=2777977 RepID=A0A928Z6E8_9CYAN|nr:winged helix-turn-helix domain-containing protein [Romeriopsis navalis]MBE9032553.1 winged helix-turn-helix domain-containing protein [Romeriopsis navalis LEGE 11480]
MQALYLLQSGAAESISHVARILGHNRITVQRWLCEYRQGGLEYRLSPRAHGGRQAFILPAVQTALRKRLKQPRGFVTYQDVVDWLATEYGITVNYWVVYDLVRRRWKAKLKRPRPSHALQDPKALEDFPKQLAHRLSLAVGVAPDLHLRDWVEDESRFGLKPISRRRVTAKGVEPIAMQHWRFKWGWRGLCRILCKRSIIRIMEEIALCYASSKPRIGWMRYWPVITARKRYWVRLVY